MSDEMNVPEGFKRCSKCKQTKPLSEFTRNKGAKDGYHHYCRICKAEAGRQDYNNNKDKYRQRNLEWQSANREARLVIIMKYEHENREGRLAARRVRYQRNPLNFKESSRRWDQKNRDKARERKRRRRARKAQLPSATAS